MSAARLARLLAGRAAIDGPLHRQLSHGLTELIRAGELPAGSRLPSERALAPVLAMSRTTVTTAYAALRDEGLLEGRQGSGTYVLGRLGLDGTESGRISDDRLGAFTTTPSRQVIDLSSAAMPGLELVAEVADAADAGALRPWLAHHGYHPGGLPALRAAIADHLTATGVSTMPDEVLVTSGAQQALQVVAGALLGPRDRVIVEDPTYRGAIAILTSAGARIGSIPTGPDGVDVEALAAAIQRTHPRLVVLLPVVHNPTGSILPDAERLAVAQLSAATGTPVVEDAAAAETVHEQTIPRPIAGFESDAEVITIGSLSKLFWGGLRIGWIRASRSMISRLIRVKGLTDLGSGMPSQLLALDLLPHADAARAVRRQELVEKHRRLTAALDRWLPSWRPHPLRGGGSLWVQLPVGNAGRFAGAALRAGVRISPGTLFSAHDRFDDHVRLPFVEAPEVLEAGVERMARAWNGFVDTEARPPAGRRAS